MKKLLKANEKETQSTILEYLTRIGAVVVKFNNVGIYIKKTGKYIPPRDLGVSDILACYKGLFFAIEVKSTGKKPTDNQLNFLQRVRDAGGIAFWTDNIDEVTKTFQPFLDKKLYKYIQIFDKTKEFESALTKPGFIIK